MSRDSMGRCSWTVSSPFPHRTRIMCSCLFGDPEFIKRAVDSAEANRLRISRFEREGSRLGSIAEAPLRGGETGHKPCLVPPIVSRLQTLFDKAERLLLRLRLEPFDNRNSNLGAPLLRSGGPPSTLSQSASVPHCRNGLRPRPGGAVLRHTFQSCLTPGRGLMSDR
jgi:hypothetical protein